MTKNHPYHQELEMVYAVLSLDWLLLKLVPYLLNYHQMKEIVAKYDQSHIYIDYELNHWLEYLFQCINIFLPADARVESLSPIPYAREKYCLAVLFYHYIDELLFPLQHFSHLHWLFDASHNLSLHPLHYFHGPFQ